MKKFVLLPILFCTISACDRRQPEGPAERAGRSIDNASNTVHDQAVRTKENAKSIGRTVKSELTPTDETVENTRENVNEIGRDVRARIRTDEQTPDSAR